MLFLHNDEGALIALYKSRLAIFTLVDFRKHLRRRDLPRGVCLTLQRYGTLAKSLVGCFGLLRAQK